MFYVGKPVPTFPEHALAKAYDKAPSGGEPDGALPVAALPSDRLLRVRPEVMRERHPAIDDSILFPLRRALRKGKLRLDDLLEQRVLRRLLPDHVVVDLELPLQYRIRSLVELHVILGLQLDVVLRIAVDRFPLHVLRRRLAGIGD